MPEKRPCRVLSPLAAHVFCCCSPAPCWTPLVACSKLVVGRGMARNETRRESWLVSSSEGLAAAPRPPNAAAVPRSAVANWGVWANPSILNVVERRRTSSRNQAAISFRLINAWDLIYVYYQNTRRMEIRFTVEHE